MATLEIIGAPQSNFVRTARIACMEKGLPYTLAPARSHSPDVDAIHPFGKIPAMRHGDLSLYETKAICSYIDLAFGGPPLIPPVRRGTDGRIELIAPNAVARPDRNREHVSPVTSAPKPRSPEIGGNGATAPARAAVAIATAGHYRDTDYSPSARHHPARGHCGKLFGRHERWNTVHRQFAVCRAQLRCRPRVCHLGRQNNRKSEWPRTWTTQDHQHLSHHFGDLPMRRTTIKSATPF